MKLANARKPLLYYSKWMSWRRIQNRNVLRKITPRECAMTIANSRGVIFLTDILVSKLGIRRLRNLGKCSNPDLGVAEDSWRISSIATFKFAKSSQWQFPKPWFRPERISASNIKLAMESETFSKNKKCVLNQKYRAGHINCAFFYKKATQNNGTPENWKMF